MTHHRRNANKQKKTAIGGSSPGENPEPEAEKISRTGTETDTLKKKEKANSLMTSPNRRGKGIDPKPG